MADRAGKKAATGVMNKLPTDQLRSQAGKLVGAYAEHAVGRVNDKVSNLTGKLTDYAEHGPKAKAAVAGGKAIAEGKSPIRGALTSAVTGAKEKVKSAVGGKEDGGSKVKVTNIVEHIDVGVPVRVAYNQWTQFQEFGSFMKKVENVDQEDDTKISWKAQVLWSHRSWDSTIVEQVADDHIVWESSGEQGYVDGAVTFHELAPNLTRIILVLEYHPDGFFEKTANLWRAQGRRARLELKHFQRQVMTSTLLDQDDVEGWRGEIKDSEVTVSHEDALAEERQSDEEDSEQDEYDDETDTDDAADEGDEEEDDEGEEEEDDEYDDEEEEEEGDDEDQEDDDAEDDDEEPADDDQTEDDEPPAKPRRRR